MKTICIALTVLALALGANAECVVTATCGECYETADCHFCGVRKGLGNWGSCVATTTECKDVHFQERETKVVSKDDPTCAVPKEGTPCKDCLNDKTGFCVLEGKVNKEDVKASGCILKTDLDVLCVPLMDTTAEIKASYTEKATECADPPIRPTVTTPRPVTTHSNAFTMTAGVVSIAAAATTLF